MTDRQTDVEDLTGDDCNAILEKLAPIIWSHTADERETLRELVSVLDRTGADWPHHILGLEPTP